jgi:hypothetical protein
MNDKHECEITILIDENGEWRVCKMDSDEINDELGNLAEDGGTMVRRVDLKCMIAAPVITEGTVDVPDDAGTEFTVAITS